LFELRDYQKQILKDLKHVPSIALYMATGTGKTITSLEKAKENPTSKLLVICPHSVIEQWIDVIKKHMPEKKILEFKKSWSAIRKNKELYDKRYSYDTVVVNFEIVHKLDNLNLLFVDEDCMIIVDEIHRIKSWGTEKKPVIATRAICKLGELTPYKAGLSATPTQGKYGGFIDYYPQLKFLGYTDLTYDEFFHKYAASKLVKYGTGRMHYEIIGYQNVGEIHTLLEIIAKRYVSKYADFEPQHNKIKLDCTKNYKKLAREKAITKGEKVIALNNSARRRIGLKTMTTGTVMGRDLFDVPHTIKDNTVKLDWLKEFLEDTEEVVAIFYQYNVELDNLVALAEKLGKRYILINGKTKDKYGEINKKDYDLVIGQFQALSESLDGLHLKCHISVFFAMPESSLTYKQALGRIDRIGQTQVPMYYYLLMQDTIDEDIMYMIEQKIEFSEKTLEKLEVKVKK
jgi:SNF2 family DNA or RNA helicase